MTGRSQIVAARATRTIVILMVVAALYFGREILVPSVLALFLTFLLQPPIRTLERLKLPRVGAVIIVVCLFLMVVAGVTVLVTEQVLDLSQRLPDYRENLTAKVRDLRASGQGTVGRLSGTIRDLGKELNTATQPAAQVTKLESEPLRVQVVDNGPGLGDIATGLIGPIMVPVAGAAITILLLIFLLIYFDDLRARMISYAGLRRISLTTSAMNEIGQRVGRFVRMQLLVNLTYGTLVGIGLYLFGVPQALLWGVLGFVLRFAPYIGPWLTAILPTLLTAAVFPGWRLALGVVGMFVLIEVLCNLVLEPWLYGKGTGISSLGVVYASVFWAWVWGPVGLLLAVPTTVCLTVMGKYLPQLSLLHQLFGEDVDVSAVGELYQGMLVGDATAIDRIVDRELEAAPLAKVCDEVLLPALAALKRDMTAGAVDGYQARRALRAIQSVASDAVPLAERVSSLRLICIPGQSAVDSCAAELLAMSCRSWGVGAEAISPQILVSEAIDQASGMDVGQVAIVQVVPGSAPFSRRLIKSLSPRLAPGAKLIDITAGDLAVESAAAEKTNDSTVMAEHTFMAIVTTLSEQEIVDSRRENEDRVQQPAA